MRHDATDRPAIQRVAQVSVGRFRVAIDGAMVEQAVLGPLTLMPLPRVPAHVLGACEIHGMPVPVFDLAAMLDPSRVVSPPTALAMVVLLRRETGHFALPIDSLHGLRDLGPEMLYAIDVQSPTGAGIFTHLVSADAQHDAAVLLDLDAMLRLSDLHTVMLPDTVSTAIAGDAHHESCFIVRAGGMTLAIPSRIVRHVDRRDRASERAFAHPVLRGFRQVDGEPQAVVDLGALLGRVTDAEGSDAMQLLSIAEGDAASVALVVRDVVGVEVVDVAAMQPPPTLDGVDAALCAGSVGSASHGAMLLLDADALLRASRIVDVATLGGAGYVVAARADDGNATNFMVYAAGGGLLASSVTDLAAIAALPEEFTDLRHDHGATIGMMPHGERTVPVTDLGVLLGKPPLTTLVGRPVLLVESPNGLVGFVVERVLFMRRATPQRLPHMAIRSHGVVPPFTATIVVDDSGRERSAALLTLVALAARDEIVTRDAGASVA